jgi:hypothetical protein
MDKEEILPSKEILKLHILYLEKIGKLTLEERAAYVKYFNMLSRPIFFAEEISDCAE